MHVVIFGHKNNPIPTKGPSFSAVPPNFLHSRHSFCVTCVSVAA